MTDQKDSGLKSAFDLAMERMAAKTGGITRLSDAQKAAIAGVNRKTQAKIAELELLYRDRLAAAQKADDPALEKVKAVDAEFQREVERAKSQDEAEKERIRQAP